MLARAIAGRPRLLVLDDFFDDLDEISLVYHHLMDVFVRTRDFVNQRASSIVQPGLSLHCFSKVSICESCFSCSP